MLFVIIADGEFDQVCVTYADAMREKRDLVDLGCEVSIKRFESWEAVHSFEDTFSEDD